MICLLKIMTESDFEPESGGYHSQTIKAAQFVSDSLRTVRLAEKRVG